MYLVRLTKDNCSQYLGYEILFKTRNKYIIKTILAINKCSVKIKHPDLNNNVEFVSRKVFVLITK